MTPEKMDGHPCGTCLHWPECNGVDVDNCPLIPAPPPWPKYNPYLFLDERTESGLLEED